MAKPVILAVDDDPQVRRADSPGSALEMPGKLKLRGDPVAALLVDQRRRKMTGVEFLRGRNLDPSLNELLAGWRGRYYGPPFERLPLEVRTQNGG